ncbi:MAG: ABC transporter permease [Chloroflexota bacterium]|nr:ABC transporter permease [Aggregatilineaceae bacterium]
MNRWIDVFRYELRMQFRRKAYTLLTFGLPALALVLFFGYQTIKETTSDGEADEPLSPFVDEAEQTGTTKIGYVDQTTQGLFPPPESYPGEPESCQVTPDEIQSISAELIKRISSPYCLRDSVLHYESRSAGTAALDAGEIEALYVIPEDYVDSGEIDLYVPSLTIDTGQRASALIENFVVATLLRDADPASYEKLYLRLRGPATLVTHSLTEGEVADANENDNFALTYAFGLILMLSLFWGGGYLMQSVVQEKESRVIEIILSSVPPVPLLLGKILAMGLASLIQVATLLGTALFIMSRAGDTFGVLQGFEINPESLVIAIVYFILGFLMFGSLMAAIGALTTSVRESQNYVTFVTLPAAVPFFFLTMFAEEPNGSVATALSIFPLTAPLSMIMRASVTSIPAGELALSIGLLVLTVIFVIWLSGRLFRVNTLLMGKTPKFKDIPKLIRG